MRLVRAAPPARPPASLGFTPRPAGRLTRAVLPSSRPVAGAAARWLVERREHARGRVGRWWWRWAGGEPEAWEKGDLKTVACRNFVVGVQRWTEVANLHPPRLWEGHVVVASREGGRDGSSGGRAGWGPRRRAGASGVRLCLRRHSCLPRKPLCPHAEPPTAECDRLDTAPVPFWRGRKVNGSGFRELRLFPVPTASPRHPEPHRRWLAVDDNCRSHPQVLAPVSLRPDPFHAAACMPLHVSKTVSVQIGWVLQSRQSRLGLAGASVCRPGRRSCSGSCWGPPCLWGSTSTLVRGRRSLTSQRTVHHHLTSQRTVHHHHRHCHPRLVGLCEDSQTGRLRLSR